MNAKSYIRDQAEDYDNWAAVDCGGSGKCDVPLAFRRAARNENLARPWHGIVGVLRISEPRYRHPQSAAFVLAAQHAGLVRSADFKGNTQEGARFHQTTTMEGSCGSTAATYLAAVKGRPGLKVLTGVRVDRILSENGPGLASKLPVYARPRVKFFGQVPPKGASASNPINPTKNKTVVGSLRPFKARIVKTKRSKSARSSSDIKSHAKLVSIAETSLNHA